MTQTYNGKIKPQTQTYYNQALEILKKDGYIKKTELLKIFNGMNLYSILLCFDRNEEDLYDDYKQVPEIYADGSKHGMKTIKIYRRLKPVHSKWRSEAMPRLPKNGCFSPVGVNR